MGPCYRRSAPCYRSVPCAPRTIRRSSCCFRRTRSQPCHFMPMKTITPCHFKIPTIKIPKIPFKPVVPPCEPPVVPPCEPPFVPPCEPPVVPPCEPPVVPPCE